MTSQSIQTIACSGLSCDEWESLLGDYERAIKPADDGLLAADEQPFFARLERIVAGLEFLREWYSGMADETARFSADPQLLAQVVHVSERRIQVIDDLLAGLRHA